MPDDDTLQFITLYPEETEAAILDRWRSWANEGLDRIANPDEWTDTREGAHWWNATTAMRREAAKLYDLMGSEVVRAIFPQWSWGTFLDQHAELRGIARRAGTYSTGTVTFTGIVGTVIAPGAVVGVPPASPDAPTQEFATSTSVTIGSGGTVDALIVATEVGADGNVSEGAITALVTPTPGVVSVTNAVATVGGTDLESDLALSPRVVESFEGIGVANQTYYRRLALDEPGVGRVTVIPHADGAGTVRIIIATPEGGPTSPETVASLQERVDPGIIGEGTGSGQTGAAVTVVTSSLIDIFVAAKVELETGYTLDGEPGTQAVYQAIFDAIANYVDTIGPGEEVVLQKVAAAIVNVAGVHDVDLVTINGQGTNAIVPAAPPSSPTTTAPAITVGTI